MSLRKLSGTRAKQVQFGRLLNNPSVTEQELISSICAPVAKAAANCEHVLAIQDTTEINYEAHAKRVSGLGTVGNGKDAGLFLHPLLAVDAKDGTCLGLAAIHHWLRTDAGVEKSDDRRIEEKESYRWCQVAQSGKEMLAAAKMVTIIGDRESDIYELWTRIPDKDTHLLIRSCHDRILTKKQGAEEKKTLYEWIGAQNLSGIVQAEVPAREGKRSKHIAKLQIRHGRVTIPKPDGCTDKNAPAYVQLSLIEVKEDPSTVVGNEKPICWRLLTTHVVEDLQKAVECVDWYRQRWQIEQLFRTLKSKGLDIESSQLEQAQSLIKLTCIATQAAVRIMQLTLARDGQSRLKVVDVFTPSEVAMIERIRPTLEGKTPKQKNPHNHDNLAYAGWVIARLGGWKGYASEAKPGPITMARGLQELRTMHRGWLLADGFRDVCTA